MHFPITDPVGMLGGIPVELTLRRGYDEGHRVGFEVLAGDLIEIEEVGGMASTVVFSGISPHPPLLIPDVGGERIMQVAESGKALAEFSRRLISTRPDTVILISPHSPFDPTSFAIRTTAELRGSFSEFGAPQVTLKFQNDLTMIKALKDSARNHNVEVRELTREYPLDHGATVPLYYLRDAGWRRPIVVIGFTDQSNNEHLAFGRAIAEAAASINRRVAVVASGDLSHRLIIGGPYEYEPTAHVFDQQIVDAVADGDPKGILNIDKDLRLRAGECGYRSIVVALGSVDQNLTDHEVLSYEGPFGVGYLVAVFIDTNRSIGGNQQLSDTI